MSEMTQRPVITVADLIVMLKHLPPDTPIKAEQEISTERFRIVPADAWVQAGPGYVRLDAFVQEKSQYKNWGTPKYIDFKARV